MALSQTTANMRQSLWVKELWVEVMKKIYFARFVDRLGQPEFALRAETSPDACIQEITDLSKKAGDRITVGMGSKLSGNGVDGDDELEGNEESMNVYDEQIIINQKRHAVRLKGQMDEKKVAYSMRTQAKRELAVWLAEKIQKDMFLKLCGDQNGDYDSSLYNFANTPTSPAATRSIWANNAGSDGALTADEVMDTKVLDAMKQMAQLASPKIRPIGVDGKSKYVVVLHPYQMTDLRKDPVFNQALREGAPRGDNPIFTGALYQWNGLVLHEHEDIMNWNGGHSSIPIARAILMGQQAGIIAYGSPVKWVEKSFDFGNKWAISCGRIWGCLKPMFNALDHGVITGATAATTASTA